MTEEMKKDMVAQESKAEQEEQLSEEQLENVSGGVDFDQLRRDNLEQRADGLDKIREENLEQR